MPVTHQAPHARDSACCCCVGLSSASPSPSLNAGGADDDDGLVVFALVSPPASVVLLWSSLSYMGARARERVRREPVVPRARAETPAVSSLACRQLQRASRACRCALFASRSPNGGDCVSASSLSLCCPLSQRYPPLRCVPTAEVVTTLLRVSWGQARTPFLPCARYSGKFRLRHRWHCNEGCFVRESESRRLCSDRQAAAPEENDSVIRRQIFSYFFSFLKSRARARVMCANCAIRRLTTGPTLRPSRAV